MLLLCCGLYAGAQAINASPNLYAANINTSVSVTVTTDHQDMTSTERAEEGSVTKSFTRAFAVDQMDKINVNNRYGSVTVKTWDRREVKAEVTIRAYSSSDAQKLLDQVAIDAAKQGDLVTFKTNINVEDNRWGNFSINGRKSRREVKVDYIIYMPANNALTVLQQYGNVTVGDLDAALSAKVQYGNFVAGKLSSNNNYISVQYGKANIAEATKATIKHQYGAGVTIGTVGTLNLDAQYTKVDITNITGEAVIEQQYGAGITIGSVGLLNINAQYTKVNVGTIKRGGTVANLQYSSLDIANTGSIKVDAQYTTVNIGQLNGDGNFKMQYNNLAVAMVGEGVKRLNADCEYVGMSFNFADRYNANVDVQTSYAGFKFGAGVSAKLTGDDDDRSSNQRNYIGKIGNGGTNMVRIKAEYGNVIFR
ncbi:MAG: hypothetical protein EOO88_26180 [Pedobacter sp.]|nr:MAG: hypothetical protein EOO88_26180 [Pedobacter sp.]